MDSTQNQTTVGRPVRWKLSKRWAVLAIALGVLTGIGAHTFRYAEGFSYFSSDPAACKNCHVMNDVFDSWRKGPHHACAVCVDCHLPHGFV